MFNNLKRNWPKYKAVKQQTHIPGHDMESNINVAKWTQILRFLTSSLTAHTANMHSAAVNAKHEHDHAEKEQSNKRDDHRLHCGG